MSFYIEITPENSSEKAKDIAESLIYEVFIYVAVEDFDINILESSHWPSLSLKINGENAYNCLYQILFELHVLEFESVSLVMYKEIDSELFVINETELIVEYFVSDSHYNSAMMQRPINVRLTHIPSGITVQCREHSQFRCYKAALDMLKAKVFAKSSLSMAVA